MSESPTPYQAPVLRQYNEPLLPPSGGNVTTEEQFATEYPVRYDLLKHIDPSIGADPLPSHLQRRLTMLNDLDRYITAHATGKRKLLRSNQIGVFKDIYEDLEQGHNEGFIDAPTGFGKTVLFSQLIEAMNQRTVVVVPSKILVEQTYEKMLKFNPNLDCGRYYSDHKDYGKQVTITTYQSLVQSNGGVRPEDTEVLILDEVHQSLTDYRIDAVNRFAGAVKIGFTATPEYTDDKRVANLLNHRYHQISLREAVAQRSLAPFSAYLAQTDVDISQVSITSTGEYNEQELEQAVDIYSRNKSAVQLYEQLVAQDASLAKAVTYCVTIKHAQHVADVFNNAGIRAAAVWSDQDAKERNAIIAAYKRGEIKVLTNVNVLTEGFDDPEAALCINLKPTRSQVVAKQRGGRVLRLDPNNPNKHAIIVDYLDKNADKRAFQVTFAQVAMGEGEVNIVQIDEQADREKSAHSSDVAERQDNEHVFNIEGLHVITNSEEVYRIAYEDMQISKDQVPEGWIGPAALSRSLGRGYDVVSGILEKIREEMKEQGREKEGFLSYQLQSGDQRTAISPEVAGMVTELVPPMVKDVLATNFPGFIIVPSTELQTEFGVPKGSFWKVLMKFQKSHPENFVQNGPGRPWFVDNTGYSLLREYFEGRPERIGTRDVAEGYHEVSMTATAKDYGVSQKVVRNRVAAIMKSNPGAIVKGNGIGKPYVFTEEGDRLLRESLSDRKEKQGVIPADFTVVSARAYEQEFHRTQLTIVNRIKRIQQDHPDMVRVVAGNSGNRYYLTKEGEELLRDSLAKYMES